MLHIATEGAAQTCSSDGTCQEEHKGDLALQRNILATNPFF